MTNWDQGTDTRGGPVRGNPLVDCLRGEVGELPVHTSQVFLGDRHLSPSSSSSSSASSLRGARSSVRRRRRRLLHERARTAWSRGYDGFSRVPDGAEESQDRVFLRNVGVVSVPHNVVDRRHSSGRVVFLLQVHILARRGYALFTRSFCFLLQRGSSPSFTLASKKKGTCRNVAKKTISTPMRARTWEGSSVGRRTAVGSQKPKVARAQAK